jgi:E3 ubiquitin-protein ligase Topors
MFNNRTTVTPDNPRALALRRLYTIIQSNGGIISRQFHGIINFRRRIYQDNLWVEPFVITERFRETTPAVFQQNPDMTYRLIPWLDRELNILIDDPEIRLSDVMEKILVLITKYPIRGRPFKKAIQSYFGSIQKTNHFIHEF